MSGSNSRVPLAVRVVFLLVYVPASQSQHKRSNALLLGSPVVDRERMRPMVDILWLQSVLLSFFQCLDTVGWVAGKASSAIYHQRFSSGTSGSIKPRRND